MYRERTSSHGFTLIELMVVLAIAAVLAIMGAPALGRLLARTRVSSAEGRVAGTLRHARATAVMRNMRVLVCPSDDGRRCTDGYDWQHGWIIAPDADGDGKVDAGSVPFAVVSALSPGTRVITSRGRAHLVFHPDGNSAGSNVRFTICHARQAQGRSVVVSNSGRVRTARPEPERLQQCLAGL